MIETLATVLVWLAVVLLAWHAAHDWWRLYRTYRVRRAARGLAERQEQGRREVADYRALIAEAQPILPTDEFGTCPNPDCDMDGYHHILKIEGNTSFRACVFCHCEFTIDHDTPTGGAA